MTRRILAGALLLVLAGLGLWWTLAPAPASGTPRDVRAHAESVSRSLPIVAAEAPRPTDDPEAQLAAQLNAAGNTASQDLAIIGTLFNAYRSLYPQAGNPVGDNRAIVNVLSGRNPAGVIFLSRSHHAVNAGGELCDRWGTPVWFHAESGTRMEIRSAGPDRRMWTPDDVSLFP